MNGQNLKLTTTNAGEDMEQQDLSFTAGESRECKWCSHSETSVAVIYKTEHMYPYHMTELSCYLIYTKESITGIYTKTCTRIFIAVLIIIAKMWKQPRCASVSK